MEAPSSTSTIPLRLIKSPEPVILADQVCVQPVAPSKFPSPAPKVMVFVAEIPAPLALRNRPPPSSEMLVLPPMLVSDRKPMVPDVAFHVPVKPLLAVPLMTMLPLIFKIPPLTVIPPCGTVSAALLEMSSVPAPAFSRPMVRLEFPWTKVPEKTELED